MRLSGLLLLLSLSGLSCDDSASSSSGAGGHGGSGGGTSATASGGSDDNSTGTAMMTTGGAGGGSAVADVHFIGRYDTTGTPRATWSGSSVLARFTGSAVAARLDGAADLWFEIVIDGASVGRLVTTGGEQLYPLASGLSGAEHEVEIVRRNEGFFGELSFLGFEVTDGEIVPSEWPYAHRIEFIGDSLTCGYGIEGPNAECDFAGDTESAYSTYAMAASRELDAAAHVICYSGKGVHQNYGGDTNEPMPVLYPRTFTGSANPTWEPSEFSADVVVVNLGTNDFSAALDEGAFVADYVTLLETARARHPSAYLLAITWAHWGGNNEALVEEAVAAFDDPDSGTLQFSIDPADGLGCDYHTNMITNAKLGALLRDTLKSRLSW